MGYNKYMKEYIDKCISPYPADYIPAGAQLIIGVALASGEDCTVKWFYDPKTGEYHIQAIEYSNPNPNKSI